MKILITGGLGFIGSAIIRGTKSKAKITVFDNLSTQKHSSLFQLPSRIKFIEGDVRNAQQVDAVCGGQDVVFHLAAITDATTSHERPKEVQEVNVGGTLNVIEGCLKYDCKLVFPSTTSVYGQATGVVDETSLVNPQSVYADSKIDAENFIKSYYKNEAYNLRAVILRLGTIYGISMGMRFHTVIPKFCWEAAMGLPLTVWETAYDQKRPYLALSDAIRAFFSVALQDEFEGDTYNVVTSNYPLSYIIETIQKFVPVEIRLTKSEIMNQLSYEVSTEKFRKAFDFEFMGDLSEEVKNTLEILGAI